MGSFINVQKSVHVVYEHWTIPMVTHKKPSSHRHFFRIYRILKFSAGYFDRPKMKIFQFPIESPSKKYNFKQPFLFRMRHSRATASFSRKNLYYINHVISRKKIAPLCWPHCICTLSISPTRNGTGVSTYDFKKLA